MSDVPMQVTNFQLDVVIMEIFFMILVNLDIDVRYGRY